jgi:hypothetical protein
LAAPGLAERGADAVEFGEASSDEAPGSATKARGWGEGNDREPLDTPGYPSSFPRKILKAAWLSQTLRMTSFLFPSTATERLVLDTREKLGR